MDASALGIGAVLLQSFEGPRPRVIANASRVFTSVEFKYSVAQLGTLAVMSALKHFRDILFGYTVYTDHSAITQFRDMLFGYTVYTDHSAVTQLLSGKNLTGRLARWYLTVMQFEPVIKCLPGKADTVADALFQLLLCLRFQISLCLSYIQRNVKTRVW